jgi:hypothetical protein
MSKSQQRTRLDGSAGEEDVREWVREEFSSHDKSKQAYYHDSGGTFYLEQQGNRHHDGRQIVKHFGAKPFWKVLEDIEESNHPAYRYPSAYLNGLIHVSDSDIWALERGDLDRFADEPVPRRRVMEWLAKPENRQILEAMDDGGIGWHAHSKPGKGKTSAANFLVGGRMTEINNETVLWQLTLEECEILPLAPFTTLAMPEGVRVDIEASPRDDRLPRVSIDPSDVFRDTIRYSDPVDLLEQTCPGAIYGVLPDPHFRGCERLVEAKFTSAWNAEGTEENSSLVEWMHGLVHARAKKDVTLHPTTAVIDEAGDMLPIRPENNDNDLRSKVKSFAEAYGKARKKNLSCIFMSHSLATFEPTVREKERLWMTMPETPTPSGSLTGLPDDIPIIGNYASRLTKGEATVWNSMNYVDISWPNPYRTYGFEGEISISYPEREEALDEL